MTKAIDITGVKFNRLTAIEPVTGSRWKFQCECGTVVEKSKTAVRFGNTKSCGCLNIESIVERNTSHGLIKHPLYSRWAGMIARCENANHAAYKNYGGRGISVSKEWHDFAEFLVDMGEPESYKLTIERRNGNGPYCKENCVWATRSDQSRNTSRNIVVEVDGLALTVRDWEAHNKVKRGAYQRRIDLGWPLNEAVTLSIVPGKSLEKRICR